MPTYRDNIHLGTKDPVIDGGSIADQSIGLNHLSEDLLKYLTEQFDPEYVTVIIAALQALDYGPISGYVYCPTEDDFPVEPLTNAQKRLAYIYNGHFYVYVGEGGDFIDGKYKDLGLLRGPQGATGPDGKSAYEVAVENGYEGEEEDWLASLKGDKGDNGTVIDGVTLATSVASLDDYTTAELEAVVPDGNTTKEIADGVADVSIDINGGTKTRYVDGKTMAKVGLSYLKQSSGTWAYRVHSNAHGYTISNLQGVSHVSGSVSKSRTDLGTNCMIVVRKPTSWSTVPEDWTDLGLISANYCITKSAWVSSGAFSPLNFDFDLPSGAESLFIWSYGTPSHTITLTVTEDEAGLKQRVAALEEGGGGETSYSESDVNNDQDCLMLRKQIIDNWAYYLTTPSDPTSYDNMNYLDGKVASVPQGKHFVFVTDTHWKDNPAKRCNYIASYVSKRLGGCPVIFGGDAVNNANGHSANDKYYGARELSVYADQFFSAFGDNSLWVCGNHDANYVAVNSGKSTAANAVIDDREIYRRTTARLAHKVVFDDESIAKLWDLDYRDKDSTIAMTDDDKQLGEAWLRLHYHYDDHANKIRYIVFETGNGGMAVGRLTGHRTSYIIPLQFAWFSKVLLSTPADYDIVVMGHEWTTNGDDSDARNMLKLLYYFRKKASSVSINMRSQNTKDGTAFTRTLCGTSANKTFNFSSSKHYGRIIVVGGHYHIDRLYQFQYNNSDWELKRIFPTPDTTPVLVENGILYMITNTDNATRDTVNEGTRPTGTGIVEEVCFDVVTLTDDNRLVCTRIGWGEDHEAGIPGFWVDPDDE